MDEDKKEVSQTEEDVTEQSAPAEETAPEAEKKADKKADRKKDKNGNHETDFIQCVAWRQTAEFIARYFAKGQMIVIEGQHDYMIIRYAVRKQIISIDFKEKITFSAAPNPCNYLDKPVFSFVDQFLQITVTVNVGFVHVSTSLHTFSGSRLSFKSIIAFPRICVKLPLR